MTNGKNDMDEIDQLTYWSVFFDDIFFTPENVQKAQSALICAKSLINRMSSSSDITSIRFRAKMARDELNQILELTEE